MYVGGCGWAVLLDVGVAVLLDVGVALLLDVGVAVLLDVGGRGYKPWLACFRPPQLISPPPL